MLPMPIPNAALSPADIPAANADVGTFARFALTFNGYEVHGSFDACAKIPNERRSTTLTELRTCLFFEQRRWHHFGDLPDEKNLAYWRSLVEQIRQRVIRAQFD